MFFMCSLMNNISHGTTNEMYTDTVVLISQLEVMFVLIINCYWTSGNSFLWYSLIAYIDYSQKGQK
jgi:hypothetical protein